jgi:hypothetical protein
MPRPRGGGSSGRVTPRSFARTFICSWCSLRIFSRSSAVFAARILARNALISSGVIICRP